MDFCHLHVHSDFSLMDGLARVDDLVKSCGDRGMSSLALTDHGSLAGAIHFYKAAKKAGIKPILGCEVYVAPGPRTDRKKDPVHNVASFHLTLLAKNLEGWHNLMELASLACTEGYYYNPRVDHDLLQSRSKGLVALSGCLKGEASFYLRTGHEKRAYDTAAWYRSVFGEDYFVEIQRNGAEGQQENNEQLRKMARDLGLPVVCSNDVHYISKDDAFAQEVRMAISTGKVLADEDRLKHRSDDFWLKGAAEMWDIFSDVPEACDSTLSIASRCDVKLPFGEFHLPQFVPPGGQSPDLYFDELCSRGLRERYGDPPPARAQERLAYEMGVIRKMGFVSYFLIVWDFIRYAREHQIPVGPGRGSAAGSIVSYCLRITDVCPLRYDLLFERFLNSERISMPDIDIDFCRDGREQVIRYVTDKYGGPSNVTQIITFGTLAARAVVRDVGRVLGVPLGEIDGLAKKIPNGPNDTLSQAIAGDPEVKSLREDPRYKELFDVSLRLEGINRHASTHAAGVVIGDGVLSRHVPVQKVGDDVVTAFSMDVLEEVGLLKMDFLGLKTLTVLDKALRLIRTGGGATIDLATLPLDDPRTWSLLQRGEALGIFQLESGGMRDLLTKLRPDRFEDLIAILALYRPGPLQSGMVDQFVRRKHGDEPVAYAHPALEPLLGDTYGTFVYQEQIMLVAQRLGGFSLNKADGLRKAMGKKNAEAMAKYQDEFVRGAVGNGVAESAAGEIWEVMRKFAEYAFNKSHTTAYAVVTYQTAWLKANHPVEFLAALMTCDMANTDKIVGTIEELRRLGITLLPPDANRSESEFTVEVRGGRKEIRFGLSAIKGLGHAVADAVVAARKAAKAGFATLSDLCEAAGPALTKAALEPMVKAGALDPLLPPAGHRAQLFAALEGALRQAASAHEDKRAGQMSLFGGGGPAAAPEPAAADLPVVTRWTDKEILAYEKESLGFYLSSHPLARHERTLRALSTAPTCDLAKLGNGARVWLGGMVTQLKTLYPKTGRNMTRKMARFRIEDVDGSVACVMFADQFEKDGTALSDEAIGFVEASVDLSRDEPDLRVERFLPVDRAHEELVTTVVLAAPEGEDARTVTLAKRLTTEFPGKAKLMLDLHPAPKVRALYRIDAKGLRPCAELQDLVMSELGASGLRFKTKKPESRRPAWQGGSNGGGGE